MALWSCSRSAKNIQIIRNAGAVPLLRKLLDSASDDVILPTVGIIQECANDVSFSLPFYLRGFLITRFNK